MRRSVVETMKRFLAAIAAVAAVCCLVPSHVQAGALNGSANLVLGQNDFTHNGANIVDGKAANGQHSVLDPTTGRLYVSDWMNNRVLWWNSANSLTTVNPLTGRSASRILFPVMGQQHKRA